MKGKYTLLAQGLDGDNETEDTIIMATNEDPYRLDALRYQMSTAIYKMTGKPWKNGYFVIIDENGYEWQDRRKI